MGKTLKFIGKTAVVGTIATWGFVRYYFNYVFERNRFIQPKEESKRFTGFEEKIEEEKNWLKENHGELVEIKSVDGLTLKGHYIKNPNEKRLILMAHGWRSSWSRDFCPEARWLYENNCSLLIIEQRGHGLSEGKYNTMGLRERYDLISWFEWINNNTDDIDIYLYGKSMGGATCLMVSGYPKLPQNVKGVIADSAYTSVTDQLLSGANQKKIFFARHPFLDMLNLMAKRRMGVDLFKYSTLDAMKVVNIPVLLIHGASDDFVSPKMAEKNYETCVSREKRLVLIEGAGHCMGDLVDWEKYSSAISDFLHLK